MGRACVLLMVWLLTLAASPIYSEQEYGWRCRKGDRIRHHDGSIWVIDGCDGFNQQSTQISPATWTKAEEAVYNAEKKRKFDAEWETLSETTCGGHYRNRKTGAEMGSTWCFSFGGGSS